MLRNKRGITLISLIITIIVLLILAGVVISFTVGNNGLIKKAMNIADKYEDSSNEEQNIINGYIGKIEENIKNEEVKEEPFTLASIGISPETTISEIVTNEDGVLNTILSNEEATQYLFDNFDDYNDVVNSQSSMQAIGNSNYALEILKETDIPEISNSPYWNLVYKNCIPRMTSDTSPSGIAYASNISYGSAYMALNQSGEINDCVCANQTFYVQYQFANDGIIPRKFLFFNSSDYGNGRNSTGYITASVDGTNYETIASFTNLPANTYNYLSINSRKKYKYYRCYLTSRNNSYSGNSHRIYVFNIYGL